MLIQLQLKVQWARNVDVALTDKVLNLLAGQIVLNLTCSVTFEFKKVPRTKNRKRSLSPKLECASDEQLPTHGSETNICCLVKLFCNRV